MTVGNNFRQKIHQALSSVRSLFPFFFCPNDRPTLTRGRAMGNGTLNWDGLMTIMSGLAQRRVRSFRKKNRAFNILRFNDALHIVLNEKYSL